MIKAILTTVLIALNTAIMGFHIHEFLHTNRDAKRGEVAFIIYHLLIIATIYYISL